MKWTDRSGHFLESQFITIEIKMQYDKWSEPEGIEQLARYLDRLGQMTGYMVFLQKKSAAELSWEDRIRREVHIVSNKEVIIYAMQEALHSPFMKQAYSRGILDGWMIRWKHGEWITKIDNG